MGNKWIFVILLICAVAAPSTALSAVPAPVDIELIDVPNDGGSSIGILWNWQGDPGEGVQVSIEIELVSEMLEEYELSSADMERFEAALAELKETLAPILVELTAAQALEQEADDALTLAVNNKDAAASDLRRAYWAAKNESNSWQHKLDKARDKFIGKTGDMEETDRLHEFIEATMTELLWAETDASGLPSEELSTRAGEPAKFGHHPTDPEKIYLEVENIVVVNPMVLNGTHENDLNEYGINSPKTQQLPLDGTREYNLKMVVTRMSGEQVIEENEFILGSAMPVTNYFDKSKTNNLLITLLFASIILIAIMVARRNPNLFIRRIQGLEAVDEAIGRATEMGKPVLYLCGLDSLATLSTLAAVNILGRVARKIADYDSELIVPCRDPVVLTVAQEVCKEAYIDQGRPDAFREDNIFFVTDDQFSYTATTCAIMMRDKPAANFFMGYYYAESLLLAETGASTGAIQIAGTDATHQLPFFITTCDYTLIGEELYAASAYMSREPMLLGSLKGQDVGKALMMLFIILQTIMFIMNSDWNMLKLLVEPL